MAIPTKPSPLGPRTAAGIRPATSTTDPVIARVRRQHKEKMKQVIATRPWLKHAPFQTRPMLRVREKFYILQSAFYWKTLTDSVMCEKRRSINKYFLEPASNPDYQKIIKKPMDFGKMEKKWDDGAYRGHSYAIVRDFNLMIDNAENYYPRGHSIHEAAKKLREIYEDECTWDNWSDWMNNVIKFSHKFDL